jgi:phage antirepressor YoqD-like protein
MPNLLPNCKTLTMSSREIADLVGKRHDKVKQSIERLSIAKRGADQAPIDLPPMGEYLDSLGRSAAEYVFSGEKGKRDSIIVVAQLSPEYTARLVDRWQELESANRVQLPDFTNPAESARAWAEQYELRAIAQQALAIAAPKVEFVDRYVENTGTMTFRQVAKLLKANERHLRQLLIDGHVMYRLNGAMTPYQNHIDAGRFEVKTGTSERNNHAFAQARFTPKGVQWVAGLWASHSMQEAA